MHLGLLFAQALIAFGLLFAQALIAFGLASVSHGWLWFDEGQAGRTVVCSSRKRSSLTSR
jgi:hypothetical protein